MRRLHPELGETDTTDPRTHICSRSRLRPAGGRRIRSAVGLGQVDSEHTSLMMTWSSSTGGKKEEGGWGSTPPRRRRQSRKGRTASSPPRKKAKGKGKGEVGSHEAKGTLAQQNPLRTSGN